MKRNILSAKSMLMLVLLIMGLGSRLSAKPNSFMPQHPAYLRALSNLRAARWLINHRPGNWVQTEDEMEAVRRIDAAIGEIKKAAIEDGKNIEDHPGVEDIRDHRGRLHKALDYLRRAHEDIDREEDNGFAHGLKHRALEHINGAKAAVERAIAAGRFN